MLQIEKTLVHQLLHWEKARGSEAALFGKDPQGVWQRVSWREYAQAMREIAKGLVALGVKAGDCVAIVGDNRIEWVEAQFGMMAIGAIPAPIYVTNTTEQTAYIVRHSQAKVFVCDKKEQLDKALSCLDSGQMAVDHIITFDALESSDPRVMSLAKLRALGRASDTLEAEVNARIDALQADATCLLIYTSGTTGVPKAVQISNTGLLAVARGLIKSFPEIAESKHLRHISYLPLCHILEQICTNLLGVGIGGEVYFCEDIKKIRDALGEVRPTLFISVPRVWEKMEAALRVRMAEAKGWKAKLLKWAMDTEWAAFQKQRSVGKRVDSFQRRLANKLVLSKIRARLGFQDLLMAGTGAAPIASETLEFFARLGICILEGYGMSETTALISSSDRWNPTFGAVGYPIEGVEVKIANDGEILVKGPNMTKGYLHMPAETAELFDAEGWLHTGDIGTLDKGLLRITGRKKELLITAGGKNIAPVEIETHLKSILGIGQAVVVGDRQPYLAALLVLDPEQLPALRDTLGLPSASLAEIAKAPKLRDFYQKQIEESCNRKLAQYQTIKKFHVLPTEFSVEGGELTPTLKLKRKEIAQTYKTEIDALFSGPSKD